VTPGEIGAKFATLLRPSKLTGLARAALWLTASFLLSWLLSLLSGPIGTFFAVLQVLIGIVLVGVALPLIWRFVRAHMLWSLRNKLVLTYLLIGFAPVVLFVTLVGISAYIAAGQFAIHLADTRVEAELDQISSENAGRAAQMARSMRDESPAEVFRSFEALPDSDANEVVGHKHAHLHRHIEAFVNGAPLVSSATDNRGRIPLGLPPWAVQLKGGSLRSVVLDGGELYLVSIEEQRIDDGRVFTLLSSLPVNNALMEVVAQGLGRVTLRAEKEKTGDSSLRNGPRTQPRFTLITGGIEPQAAGFVDIRVGFASTIAVTDWETGNQDHSPIVVNTRPSLLYQQLFGSSISGVVTDIIRIGLVALCIIFAIIELLALSMAIRLTRTMTASVTDLYDATLRIDRGELHHRIAVSRTDQLADLSRSFNRMSGSLQRLLGEEQEKERLQNELSIAQEVQANLFPTSVRDLPTLELHGVCRPARSVSGDYYDFLVFSKDTQNGHAGRVDTGVGIAIGDISGKGISAALLMATLHSAVRAYRFSSEAMVYSESSVAGLTASRDGRAGDSGELFESPGRIMSLLNRHLYRSTQPEKYATLFLAHYDSASSWLTYSNAGQLPPLLLGRDGAIRRLDKGGTVVGLMDGMKYEEGRFQMQSGDILVAYSDGVTEPENDFGDFGEERLMEVVARYRDHPLHVISAQVMQALDAWIGADEQPDDITLVLARQV